MSKFQIKTLYKMLPDKNNIMTESLVLYFEHNGKEANSAINSKCIDDPFELQKSLDVMIQSALGNIYPEYTSLVGITKNKIKILEKDLQSYKDVLASLE